MSDRLTDAQLRFYAEQICGRQDDFGKAIRECIERRRQEAKAWDCVRRLYAAFYLDKAGINMLAKVDAIEFAQNLAREAGVSLE